LLKWPLAVIKRRRAFPLHELFIAAAFLALIVAGVYYLIGAWGAAFLWGVGTLFLLPLVGSVAALFVECAVRFKGRQRLVGSGVLLGAVAAASLWLVAVGYRGYRAYQAIP